MLMVFCAAHGNDPPGSNRTPHGAMRVNRKAQPTVKHPWRTESSLPNTHLLVAQVSAQPLKIETSRKQQKTSSVRHGGNPHTNSVKGTKKKNGLNIVMNGTWTQTHQI